jgi:hypothetical protein
VSVVVFTAGIVGREIVGREIVGRVMFVGSPGSETEERLVSIGREMVTLVDVDALSEGTGMLTDGLMGHGKAELGSEGIGILVVVGSGGRVIPVGSGMPVGSEMDGKTGSDGNTGMEMVGRGGIVGPIPEGRVQEVVFCAAAMPQRPRIKSEPSTNILITSILTAI